jgi:Spy/CpxP family protein refolding chaperone
MIRRHLLFVGVVLVSLAVATPVRAQEQPASPATDDPIFSTLFTPELIMQHRRAIGLTDEQRDAISRMIQDLQGRVVRLQWELMDEVQRLEEVTAQTRVDLDRALDQMGAVLETENEIKRAHLEMLVRIKNLLSAEQQATLERLRGG